jgi:hypothetical protein
LRCCKGSQYTFVEIAVYKPVHSVVKIRCNLFAVPFLNHEIAINGTRYTGVVTSREHHAVYSFVYGSSSGRAIRNLFRTNKLVITNPTAHEISLERCIAFLKNVFQGFNLSRAVTLRIKVRCAVVQSARHLGVET